MLKIVGTVFGMALTIRLFSFPCSSCFLIAAKQTMPREHAEDNQRFFLRCLSQYFSDKYAQA
jgi:hypothetical protein